MKIVALLLGLTLSLLIAASSAFATVGCTPTATWCGTYNGTWQSWDGFNGDPDGSIANFGFGFQNEHFTFRTGVEGQAFRAIVNSNATTGGQAGQRTLVYLLPSNTPSAGKTAAYQGSDQWYRTQMLFDASFEPVPNSTFNWVQEWHNWPDGSGCANLALSVVTNTADGGPAGG